MHTPPALKKGDKIGIVAPAGKINKESILPALNKLHEWGLEIELGKHIFNENFQFAGTDDDRTADLQKMLDDRSIKLIISARGGYGMLRIIDKLDFKIFSKHPKWIVGYSDITVLHAHIHRNYGIETVHAIMANIFDKNEEAVDTLRKALFNEPLSYRVESHLLNRKGKAEGEVIGGNLSLLYALSASRSDIDTKGKLLFIEDLNEYLYHIDRMMMNLKRAGKLKGLAGLVVGGMTDMKDNPNPFGKTAEEIIFEAVSEYNYPVCFNFPAGHIEKNLALVFGRKARFSVDDTGVMLRYD
ncbi:MAG: LD-carboxypeptidase [Bacteroidetes bacterium]|nr:LD-carboxypeptidase [Bacteroidota bacterium]